MEVIQEEQAWDLKKIIAFALLLLALGLTFKSLVLDQQGPVNLKKESTGVAGVNTSQIPPYDQKPSDLKRSVETKINDLQKEVSQINVVEVATSTPAVQKILNDLKNLQNLPQSQAKQACLQICNGL